MHPACSTAVDTDVLPALCSGTSSIAVDCLANDRHSPAKMPDDKGLRASSLVQGTDCASVLEGELAYRIFSHFAKRRFLFLPGSAIFPGCRVWSLRCGCFNRCSQIMFSNSAERITPAGQRGTVSNQPARRCAPLQDRRSPTVPGQISQA